MGPALTTARYNRVAIILHWLIAIFILGLVPVGLWMEDAPKAIQISVYQLHKSFGLMVLFLSLARLGWRFMNPPPPLPDTMKAWERLAAQGTHIVFYGLIIAIPLSGWMMVSASPKNIPTMFLTQINWPHIWFLAQMGAEHKKGIAGGLHEVHELLAFGTIGLLLLHVGAALKHQFINKDNEMTRMIPAMGESTPPVRKPRGALLVFGGTALLFVTMALLGNLPEKAIPANRLGAQANTQGNWIVDPANSKLAFAFTHSGRTVEGNFTRWNADILFDPDDLASANITVHVDLGSAQTGDVSYDKSLPEADWFDIASASEAVFQSQSVRKNEDGEYIMVGHLTLRGLRLPLFLVFGLDINGDEAFAQGVASLDRLAFGIGTNADPGAGTVSKIVQVQFRVKAKRRAAS